MLNLMIAEDEINIGLNYLQFLTKEKTFKLSHSQQMAKEL